MQNQSDADTQKVARLLPYSPTLRHMLRSYGASLLLIYLEREYPPSQDSSFHLQIDRTLVSLNLPLHVFRQHLTLIAVGWRSAKREALARLAGRQFVTTATKGAGAHKPYSFHRLDKNTLVVTRNKHRLMQLLTQAGLADDTGPGTLYPGQSRGMDGYTPRLFDFDEAFSWSAEDVAKSFISEVIAPLNDARRRKGITRRPHHRRPWTAERRAKFDQTIRARSVDKRIISDVPNE